MKLLLLILSLLFCASANAQTFVASASATSFAGMSFTTGSAGHLVVFGVDSSTDPSSCTYGGHSLTHFGTSFSNAISKLSGWYDANSTSGVTTVTCVGGGTVHAVYFFEYSGMITTSAVVDWGGGSGTSALPGAFCNATGNPVCTTFFTPSTANEAIVALVNCGGTASSFTGSTWLHTSFPGGEGGGTLTTSAIALITIAPNSGCLSGSGMGGMIMGFRASGGTGTTCNSTFAEQILGAQAVGTNPTATATIVLHNTGDLAVIYPWCYTGCTSIAPTLGSQTGVLVNVGSNTSANTGQPFIYYILSINASGSKTLTFTNSGGAPTTQSQVAMKEFVPNPGCTYSHDIDASLGTGTAVSPNTPSITPTTGDLLTVFTASQTHINSVDSPWSCVFFPNAQTGNCAYITTRNADGYILSAASGATANAMTQPSSGDWQALITSFKLTGSGGPACTPTLPLLGVGRCG
jgi:hypothetical protein